MNRRRAFHVAAGLCLLLVFAALAVAQNVRYNYMPGTDFSKYKTYKWVQVEGGAHPDQMVDAQIKQAIDSQLVSKGLTKTDSETADMFVGYQIAVDKERQWNAMSMGPVRFGGMGTATSSTINIGTLVLDMYDAASKKQVWRGDATETINPSGSPEKNQKNLEKSIAKLLKNYPPPAK